MKVSEQEPKANEVVELQAKINVRVEPTGVLVPKVTEMTVQEAMNLLAKAGLRNERPAKCWKQDVVVAQDPPPYAPGQPNWLPRGQAVRLTPQVVTPDVSARGAGYPMPLAEAEQLLRSWDLEPDHPWLDLAELKESGAVVVGQTPRGGDRLPHGAKVRLDVRTPVPNLVNRSYSQAEQALRRRGFDLKTDADPLRGDIVASQRPRANELVAPRTAVELAIQRRVPSLQGLTVERASQALEELKFKVKLPPQARSEDILAGETDPPAGSAVEPGAAVALGRALTRMPNIVGKTIDEAKAILDGEAFPVEIPNDLQGGDRVTSQRPAAGSNQERGALVRIDARVPVPKVLDLPVGQALDVIGQAPGELRGVDEPAAVASDRVIEQFPKAGALVRPRTEIALTPGFRVPNLVGMSYEEAQALLEENQIPSKVSDYKLVPTNDQEKIGSTVIISQALRAGSSVARGSTLYFKIEKFEKSDAPIASPSSAPRRNRVE